MKSWKLVPFEELYAEPSRNGLTRPKRVRGSGYKMINMGEIFAYNRIRNPPMELVPLNDKEKKKYCVKAGDLLFARQSLVASGAGKCSIVLETPEITTFESHLIRVRFDSQKTVPLFYFYYFNSPQGKGNIQSLIMQVAAAGIRGSELAKLLVPYPPFPTQQKIATILSAYDELIENNARRIQILEEMAQLIYREWFVNFRFPDHENAQMVDSQLGKIPEGWRVHKLDELINLQKGKKPRNTYEVATTESMPYLLIEGLKNGNFSYTDDTKIRIAHKNDVIMVMDGASSGDVYIGFEGAVGSTLAYIRPRNKELLSPYVLFLFLKEKNAEIKANYIGAAIPHVNKDHLKDMEIVTPTKDLNNRFHKFISDIFAQIENLRIKNTNLRQTRDLLLPKLISGEINVGELEIISGGWENE